MKNFLDLAAEGRLDVDVRLVLADSASAGGLRFAEDAGIPWAIVRRKDFSSTEDYSRDMFQRCRERGVELVALAGFLKLLAVPDDFANRVVNIHPALIPAFCGKGYYGHHVHEAVLEYGAKLSGCTVHFVDNEYDHGAVILQKVVEVLDDDTPDSLADRVFLAELLAFPEALQAIAEGRLSVEGRRVRIAARK